MLITLCGASGSGKSSLASYIASLNFNNIHINIDEIGHQVLTKIEVIKEIKDNFNITSLSDGNINRKELANIVFNNHLKMEVLTKITWKYMEDEIDKIISMNQGKIIILDWILITKTKYFKEGDINILVKSNFNERKKRAKKRDNISEEKFIEREKMAVVYDENLFDYVIENNDIEISKRKVKIYYDKSIIPRKF